MMIPMGAKMIRWCDSGNSGFKKKLHTLLRECRDAKSMMPMPKSVRLMTLHLMIPPRANKCTKLQQNLMKELVTTLGGDQCHLNPLLLPAVRAHLPI